MDITDKHAQAGAGTNQSLHGQQTGWGSHKWRRPRHRQALCVRSRQQGSNGSKQETIAWQQRASAWPAKKQRRAQNVREVHALCQHAYLAAPTSEMWPSCRYPCVGQGRVEWECVGRHDLRLVCFVHAAPKLLSIVWQRTIVGTNARVLPCIFCCLDQERISPAVVNTSSSPEVEAIVHADTSVCWCWCQLMRQQGKATCRAMINYSSCPGSMSLLHCFGQQRHPLISSNSVVLALSLPFPHQP